MNAHITFSLFAKFLVCEGLISLGEVGEFDARVEMRK